MHYDVIIIGAGSIGMATGYYLAKQNKSVALVDAYDPPHEHGSHHGDTRIIRHAYGEGENYVPMALRAQELWVELEKESKRKLFSQTGVVNIGTEDSPFIHNVVQSAKVHDLDVEQLSAEDMNRRWPGFSIPAHLIGCYEKKSGVLLSEACIQAYKELAIENGACLYTNNHVKEMEISGDKVTVRTETHTIKGSHLIITAGKGTNHILSFMDEKLPLQPTRKTFSWFTTNESMYREGIFPAWTYNVAGKMFYSFPSMNEAGVKIGRHDGGAPVNPNVDLEPFGMFSEDIEDVSEIMSQMMSEAMVHQSGKVCTYTNTPDGDFIIDQLKNYENVFVACGFSGHGFKFSSVIGEVLCQLITQGKSRINMKQFSLSRF